MAFDGQLFPHEWSLALQGELQDYTDQAAAAVHRAALQALRVIAAQGKEKLRGMVVQAGLGREGAGEGRGTGRSLASAVRFEVYENKGDPRGPAALLYVQPSATHIYRAFEDGAKLSRGPGKFLTIPIPGSPASREVFGDKPRGQSVLESLKDKGIEFFVVKGTSSRPAMLVARSARLRQDKRGRTRVARAAMTKSGSFSSGAASIPMFFLVPTANLRKRLSLRAEFRRLGARFFELFSEEFAKQMARIEAASREAV